MGNPEFDNTLLLEILQIVKEGNSFGFQTVKDVIKKMERFKQLTDIEFKDHWDILITRNCLTKLDQKNVSVNEQTDCISYYQEIIGKDSEVSEQEKEEKRLQKRKLINDVKIGENVLKTYRFTRFAAIIGFISGIVLLTLKLLEAFGISLKL